mmetsp:Transcript_7942/g.49043  ORF Transcript_7942/g.49043 Transcript_7942/m.49043 type:complete len:244 (-) Transcript_7942:22-753(-)
MQEILQLSAGRPAFGRGGVGGGRRRIIFSSAVYSVAGDHCVQRSLLQALSAFRYLQFLSPRRYPVILQHLQESFWCWKRDHQLLLVGDPRASHILHGCCGSPSGPQGDRMVHFKRISSKAASEDHSDSHFGLCVCVSQGRGFVGRFVHLCIFPLLVPSKQKLHLSHHAFQVHVFVTRLHEAAVQVAASCASRGSFCRCHAHGISHHEGQASALELFLLRGPSRRRGGRHRSCTLRCDARRELK